jgi:hypothetical protein
VLHREIRIPQNRGNFVSAAMRDDIVAAAGRMPK